MKLYHLNDYCTSGLPLAVWPVQKAGVNVLHRHDCIELAFITRGSGVCRINDVPYPVLRGDVYMLTPEDTHAYEMAPSCTFYNILFHPDLMGGIRLNRQLYQFENEEIAEEDRRFTTLIRELKLRQAGHELMARALFTEFLVKLMRMEGKAYLAPSRQLENESKVLEYIAANLGRTVPLRELARVANMSTSALGKTFRRWTGGSITEYTASLRIRKARQLLEERALPIGEIALKLGFYDSCHFSRIFRKRTGISPREYRKLQ